MDLKLGLFGRCDSNSFTVLVSNKLRFFGYGEMRNSKQRKWRRKVKCVDVELLGVFSAEQQLSGLEMIKSATMRRSLCTEIALYCTTPCFQFTDLLNSDVPLIEHREKEHLAHASYLFPTFHEAAGFSSCLCVSTVSLQRFECVTVNTLFSFLTCSYRTKRGSFKACGHPLILSTLIAAQKHHNNKQTEMFVSIMWNWSVSCTKGS